MYNFKNPVRHFLNINNISCPTNIDNINLKHLSWSKPINFRVKKQNNKYRILKMPNILNFLCAYNKFKNSKNFICVDKMDEKHKRLVPNIKTGEFVAGVYDVQLEEDLKNLCIYDNLLKLDIKSYYERIYTHDIDFENEGDERYLTNLNLGNTNGLIMGNYISLYFAEKFLSKISRDIEEYLDKEKIECRFSYFSDDFYFFCNKKDNEKVINIFDYILEKYNLERNDKEIDIWTYLTYNNYNVIEKYWKKIISECRKRYDDKKDNNKLYFTNQLIYRMSNLEDDRLKNIFLRTFFKSRYFYELDIEKYYIEPHNYHQLCYIFKFCPEVMIYSIHKFKFTDYFTNENFQEFLRIRYNQILLEPYNEEQLYYYYAIKMLNMDWILKENSEIVAKSNNQLLISYYLMDNLFSDDIISKLKLKKEEKYWFQNYHLILFSDLYSDLENSIKEYLIPEYAKREEQKNTYINFYKHNLELKTTLINDIDNIYNNINQYMECRIEEIIEIWGETAN